MDIVCELGAICRQLRRLFHFTFRRKYVLEQLKKRKGICGQHGCCDMTVLGKFFSRNCLDGKKCTKWGKLPFRCYAYPFDEKDKNPKTKAYCNFYWASDKNE